jgi:hypothetical protein
MEVAVQIVTPAGYGQRLPAYSHHGGKWIMREVSTLPPCMKRCHRLEVDERTELQTSELDPVLLEPLTGLNYPSGSAYALSVPLFMVGLVVEAEAMHFHDMNDPTPKISLRKTIRSEPTEYY